VFPIEFALEFALEVRWWSGCISQWQLHMSLWGALTGLHVASGGGELRRVLWGINCPRVWARPPSVHFLAASGQRHSTSRSPNICYCVMDRPHTNIRNIRTFPGKSLLY